MNKASAGITFKSASASYHLDLHAQLLWRGDRRIELTPKQWEVLRFLAERPMKLVSSDDLLDAIWGKHESYRESLGKVISQLRRILDDNAQSPCFIENAHGRGYRFIAEVTSPNEAFAANNGPTSHDDETPAKGTSNTAFAGRNGDGSSVGVDDRTINQLTAASGSKYTDGDWIAAAIVGSEHAETKFKALAAEFRRLTTSDRTQKLERIEARIQSEIDKLLEKHARGGDTDETRFDACLAKVVADYLQRELANFQWNVDERENEDPVTVFRDTVKAFAAEQKNKWSK